MQDMMLGFAGKNLAEAVEAQIHELGEWDAPASIWDIEGHDLPEGIVEFISEHRDMIPPEAIKASMTMHVEEDEVDPFMDLGVMGFGFSPRIIEFLEGHPADSLVGKRAGPEAIGAILVTEGWDYSDEVKELLKNGERPDFPPSQDPNCREVRLCNLAWRDGTEALVQRHRDNDEIDVWNIGTGEDEIKLGGRVISALRLYLGKPSEMEVEHSAVSVARTMWLYGILTRAEQVHRFDPDQLKSMLAEFKEIGLPDIACQFFEDRSGDGICAVSINSAPSDVVEHSSLPWFGLGQALKDVKQPDWDPMKLLEHIAPLGEDVEPGSPEDLEVWERCRLAQIEHMQGLRDEMDEFMADSGKREIAGLPGYAAKEMMDEKLKACRWMDAAWYAYSVDPPSKEWLFQYADDLIKDGAISPVMAQVLFSLSIGLEPPGDSKDQDNQ